MDMIPWPEVGVGSGWLFVGLFVYAILSGKLVPRATLTDATHDRDEWRAESRIKDAQIHEKDSQLSEKDKQLGHMAEVGRNTLAIMHALKATPEVGS